MLRFVFQVLVIAIACGPAIALGQSSEAQRTEGLLRRLDANGNGTLEVTEVPIQYRPLLDRAARRGGMDPSRPLRIEAIARAAANNDDDDDDDDDRDRNRRRGGDERRGDERRGDGDRGGERRGGGPGRGMWGSGGENSPFRGGPGGPGGRSGDENPFRGGPGRRGGDENPFRGGPFGGGPGFVGGSGRGGEGGPWAGWGGWGGGGREEGGEGRGGRGRDRDRDRNSRDQNRGDGRTTASAAPLVPGFGANPNDPTAAIVPGFDGAPLGGASLLSLEQRFDERVLDYVDKELLAKYDRNTNKMLDRDEWEGVPWGDDPKTDDKDDDNRLSREELSIRMVRRWGYGEKRPGAVGSGNNFTVAVANVQGSQRTREYAEALMRQYDANKSGSLEPEEWKQMRGDPGSGDRNGDGRLTVDELALRFAGGGERREGDREERRRGNDERGADRKPYRVLTAAERLPKGIPDWFKSKDANADGQVAMAEYGTSWSDNELAEYQKWDANNDGYITPEECVPKTKTIDARVELSKAMSIQVRAAEDQVKVAEYQARVAEEISRQRIRDRGGRDRERRSDNDNDGDRRSGRDE